jgi:hypothetical protein
MNKERSITLEKHPLFALVRATWSRGAHRGPCVRAIAPQVHATRFDVEKPVSAKRPKYSGDFAKLNIRVLFAGQLANELASHRLFPAAQALGVKRS